MKNSVDKTKLILAAIRSNELLPSPVRDHIGETNHGHEDDLALYTLELPSGKKVSVEFAPVKVGTTIETFVYGIIELN